MTNNRSVLLISAVALILLALVPAVSADTVLIDETIEDRIDTSGIRERPPAASWATTENMDKIVLNKIESYPTMHYIGVIVNSASKAPPEGRHEITYRLGDDAPKNGVMYVTYNKNILGQTESVRYILFFYDWDIGTKTGRQAIMLSRALGDFRVNGGYFVPTSGIGGIASGEDGYYYECLNGYKMNVVSSITFKNHLTVNKSEFFYNIQLFREFDSNYFSTIELIKNNTVIHRTSGSIDTTLYATLDEIDGIKLITPGNQEYFWNLYDTQDPGEPGEPDGIPINIRIQNSQTGALLADSHIVISASVNGEFHEVVNETLPAGTKTYYLQPTGGGLPNPDFYRLIATVEGYNPIMPYIDFEADIATTIYAYLNPIGGAPVNENKTFIDFYVRDLNANPVSGATVKFGAYTLLTNSAGYTIFEVDKDKLYVWTVSKAGYGSVTGNAVIGSNDRYTINAVIAPAVTPTLTTPIPTKTPVKPTPTMTAPTGEPVSNLLEWFAAHFGMILGGGVEIGKIFMWLCFTIPAGVYVGKQAKAGAAGFMAGAGLVTLFFVIIGWVPIWLVVIIALIIGLLYAKAFSNIGNGGGR